MRDNLWLIFVSFGMAGIICGIFAAWLYRLNRAVYLAFAERRISHQVGEFLKRLG